MLRNKPSHPSQGSNLHTRGCILTHPYPSREGRKASMYLPDYEWKSSPLERGKGCVSMHPRKHKQTFSHTPCPLSRDCKNKIDLSFCCRGGLNPPEPAVTTLGVKRFTYMHSGRFNLPLRQQYDSYSSVFTVSQEGREYTY